MSDSAPKPAAAPVKKGEIVEERRSNEVLRALVNEMLERVRELSRRTSAWSAEERAQAEAELEAIMAHVRREAARQREPQQK